MRLTALLAFLSVAVLPSASALGQSKMEQVPARQAGEGEGPYTKLVLRGAMVIKGDGTPPVGPMDIVIAGNRIAAVDAAGTPGVPLKANRPPRDATREIDASGMWVMPGF